jgi:tetratricopeptide (TPR) repeat protein
VDEVARRGPRASELADTALLPDGGLVNAFEVEPHREGLEAKCVALAERLRANPALAGDPASAAEIIYEEVVGRQKADEPSRWNGIVGKFPQYAQELRALRLADLIVGEALGPPTAYGMQFGDYELLEQIGSGGMGVVYRAIQKPLGRTVAVKLLRGGEFANPAELDRFMKEALAVSQLNHPNIVQIYNVGATAVRPFISFEFVDGSSLANRINGTPLPAQLAASIVETVSRAIQYANDHGIVHRDLKPANVLLSTTADGEVPKVTDFGACKRINERDTHERTQIVGTPAYMAPEQLDLTTQLISVRTDVYGLGAILYECLTGLAPFRGASVAEVLRQVVEEMPIAPRLLNPRAPRDLETICLKCLQKSPKDRYESAAAVAEDLRRFLNGEPVKARPLGPVGRTWRWCLRKPGAASLVALLLIAILAGLSGITVQWCRAEAALKSALASDVEAQQLLSELIESNPVVPVRGYRPIAPSIESLLKAEAHCKKLLQKNPGEITLRIALTKVYGRLGTLYRIQGQAEEADTKLREAQDLWEPMARDVGGNRDCLDWLATTYLWDCGGGLPRHFQMLQRADAIWQKLADAEPGSLDLMHKIWECRFLMAGYIGSEVVRDDCLRPLEQSRAELNRLVRQDPSDGVVRKRLALTCFFLGDICSRNRSAGKASSYWRESFEHYSILAKRGRDDLLGNIALAISCSRLIQGQPNDPYYLRAVSLLEQTGLRLNALLKQEQTGWLEELLLEDYCYLALCHAKAGQTAKAELVSNDRVGVLTTALNTGRIEPVFALDHATTLVNLGQLLREAKQSAAALRLARQAAELCSQLAVYPSHDLAFLSTLSGTVTTCSALANQLGEPTLALQQAELGRRTIEEWIRTAPDGFRHEDSLSSVLERIGKARWSLGECDQALAAFGESAAIQKQVFEREQSNHTHRASLSGCYNRLFLYRSLVGDLRGAANAISERTKLWPDIAEQLTRTAEDFASLAERVKARSRGHLSHEDQVEHNHYLAESRRLRRAAEAAAHREGHDLRVER